MIPVTGRRFDLVIFDCDAVLIDSEPIINRAHAEMLAAYGCEISEQAEPLRRLPTWLRRGRSPGTLDGSNQRSMA